MITLRKVHSLNENVARRVAILVLAVLLPACQFGYETLNLENQSDVGLGGAQSGDDPETSGTSSGGTSGNAAAGGTSSGGTTSSGGATNDPVQSSTGGSGGGGSPLLVCGDAVVDGGEDCDDGGESSTCNDDCTSSTCGDDIVNATAGEECEPSMGLGCGDDCRFNYAHHLVHRYSFDEVGATLVDSIGGADGTVMSSTLDGSGQMTLAGGTSGQYADLPNGMISSLRNATFELWLDWDDDGSNWQRVFEFGSSEGGEDVSDAGYTYLALVATATDGNSRWLRLSFTNMGNPPHVEMETAAPLPTAAGTHVAVVVDDDNDVISLYVDGTLLGQAPFTLALGDLDDVNNWLGRSQFVNDSGFSGAYDEFRIYDQALSETDITESRAVGPDL